MQSNKKFIGVDVSKLTLDVAVHGGKHHIKVANGSEGFKQLAGWLRSLDIALGDCWMVFEYTGGYEYRLVQWCGAKQICFTRVAGLEIKKSLGMQRGKTDKTDAARIAGYGYEKREKLTPQTQSSTEIQRIKILLSQRQAYVEQRKANEHRLTELMAMMDLDEKDVIIKSYRQTADFLQKHIDKTEAEMMKLIKSDEALQRSFTLLTSIPGIGRVNAWTTIAVTENFTRFANGRKYGAYCGIVPYEHSSGTSIRGKSRVSHMANKEVKELLDMAARAAMTHDPEMKTYYGRRSAMNKHYNAIKNEVKFKLVLRMFAVVNKGTEYVKKSIVAA